MREREGNRENVEQRERNNGRMGGGGGGKQRERGAGREKIIGE